MIDCYTKGGVDDKYRIWVYCEVCCLAKYIKNFTLCIKKRNCFEVCNLCMKKYRTKTSHREYLDKLKVKRRNK